MTDIIDAITALHPNCSFTLIGDDYSKIHWVDVPESPATIKQVNDKLAELRAVEPMRLLRQQRNQKLSETDWMAYSDVKMTDDWKTYRQALRDLPSDSSAIFEEGRMVEVDWPTEPE